MRLHQILCRISVLLTVTGVPHEAAPELRAATLTVRTVADDGSSNSLRKLMDTAAPGDTIDFDLTLSGKRIQLTKPLIPLQQPTIINIDASALPGGLIILGPGNGLIYRALSGDIVSLKGISLQGGINKAGAGGAIENYGTLTLDRCTLVSNSSATDGGAIYNASRGNLSITNCFLATNAASAHGGGIYNEGTLTVTQCTISGNASKDGGGIHNVGTLTMSRCAVLGNQSTNGGGIYNEGALTVSQCTVFGNTASLGGGGIRNVGTAARLTVRGCTISGNDSKDGGGIYIENGSVNLGSGIVAGNTATGGVGPDIRNEPGTIVRVGQNLIGNNSTVSNDFPLGNPNKEGDLVGSPDEVLDPHLAPLGDYGGLTKTMPPLKGSPAIDAGGAGPIDRNETDQRGFRRVVGEALDLGAVEAQGKVLVTMETDRLDPPVTLKTSISLREALFIAVPGDSIRFDTRLSGKTIRLTHSAGELKLAKEVHIDATGLAKGLTLSGESDVRVFRIDSGVSVSLMNMTICGGHTEGGGGGILNKGVLKLDFCTLFTNTASAFGGGILNEEGSLILNHCTLAGNSAQSGGGLCCRSGTLSLNHCTVAANHATEAGGGIALRQSSLTLTNSIIAANMISANESDRGQDIYRDVGEISRFGSSLIGANNTVTDEFPEGPLAGTATKPLDPLLAPLGDYGGPTPTMPPLIGSPALDASTDSVAPTSQDQRGFPRLVGAGLDLGAVEDYRVMADGAWDVQEIISNRGQLNSLSDAEELAANPAGATIFHYQSQVINRHDPDAPGGGGFFEGDQPFAVNDRTPSGFIDGNDDDFLLLARCVIRVTNAGAYTFGFSSDDGARLRIFGTNFTDSTWLNPEHPTGPAHTNNTLSFSLPTGNSDTLGVCYLQPGTYGLEFLTWEGGGEAYCEVFVAQGAKTRIDTGFRLVGHAPSTPANHSSGTDADGWKVVVLKHGATSLASAAAQIGEYWSGSNRPYVPTYTNLFPFLNFGNPEPGGGGHGFAQLPFPGSDGTATPFAFGAQARLNVEPAGEYTFCLLSDDGARFRIKGSRGWTVSSGNRVVSQPQALLDGMQINGCCADVFGTVRLRVQPYDIEVIYNKMAGSAYLGLWMARGRYDTFSPAVFSLVTNIGGFRDSTPVTLRDPSADTPPINDNLAKTSILTEAAAGAAGSNRGASLEPNEPRPLNLTNSIWWKWMAPAAGWIQADTVGSTFDTVLAVYSGSNFSDLTLLASDDNGGPNNTSRLTFEAVQGTCYFFQIGSPLMRAGLARLNLGPAPTLANGTRAGAESLDSVLPLSVSGHTTRETESAWFTWTAPPPGQITQNAHVLVDNVGSSFPAKLSVYKENGDLLATNGGSSYAAFTLAPGNTYYIEVGATDTNSAWGAFVLNITADPFPLRLIVPPSRPATNEIESVFVLEWYPEPFASYRIEQTFDLPSSNAVWTTAVQWSPSLEAPFSYEKVSVLITNGLSANSVFFRLCSP